MTDTRHQVIRLRHETARRTLTVVAIEPLSAHMLRVTLAGEELAGFVSASFDDHLKLIVEDGAGGTAMRDYTPRVFDAAAGTLAIEFALHEAGPATRWARAARVGDRVQIGGPRGSAVIPDDFDWYWLVGDETALPAIGRRLEELRAGVPVAVVALVEAAEDELALSARERLAVSWVHRGGRRDDDAALLAAALPLATPAGEGHVWIAAEAEVARALRARIVETLGHPRAWTKAAGYWHAGGEGAHTVIED